jgi:hypothetical protein
MSCYSFQTRGRFPTTLRCGPPKSIFRFPDQYGINTVRQSRSFISSRIISPSVRRVELLFPYFGISFKGSTSDQTLSGLSGQSYIGHNWDHLRSHGRISGRLITSINSLCFLFIIFILGHLWETRIKRAFRTCLPCTNRLALSCLFSLANIIVCCWPGQSRRPLGFSSSNFA